MADRIFITSPALSCALGDHLDTIQHALQHPNISARIREVLVEKQTLPYYAVPDSSLDSETAFLSQLERVVTQTLNSANLNKTERATTGVFVGSTSMDISLREQAFLRHSTKTELPGSDGSNIGNIPAYLARLFGLGHMHISISTACTASSIALIEGMNMIRAGVIERALIVGVEGFNYLTLCGFDSLLLLSTVLKPFDKHREGLILGEAYASLLLEKEPKKANKSLELLGGAVATDTESISGNNTGGEIPARAMAQALHASQISAAEIKAIKAHGTGSVANDLSEAQAISQVFGPTLPPITAFKPYVGHTLGASGVTELILLSLALEAGFIPKTFGFQTKDPALKVTPTTHAAPCEPGAVLLNAFGFGGSCCSYVVSNLK